MSERGGPGAELRRVLEAPGCAIAAGAYDPVVAKLVERAGFPVAYVSGSGSATCVGGFPDVGLLSFSELLANARHIANATTLPVLADVDTGFGGVTNVKRTIREFEAIGVAGVHIEDQVFPKRCGQTAGASIIDTAEMAAKIHAAKEAQQTDDFVLIVRTDARQCEGFEATVERGRAYVAAGADAIFPEALLAEDEFRRYREAVDVPLVIDVRPTMTIAELEVGLRPRDLRDALRVALGTVRRLADLHAEGRKPWLPDVRWLSTSRSGAGARR